MLSKEIEETIQRKYEQLAPYFNESSLRMWAASEALSWGHGGITSVSRATGLSRTTVHAGIAQLEQTQVISSFPVNHAGIRRSGGGRKRLNETDPTLLKDLKFLVDPATRGDPESPLCWTSKSTPKLTKELQAMGHQVSQRTVCRLLWDLRYS